MISLAHLHIVRDGSLLLLVEGSMKWVVIPLVVCVCLGHNYRLVFAAVVEGPCGLIFVI